MITRFALFQGKIDKGDEADFRNAVLTRLVPLWKQFPGASEVRVMFSDDRDEGAPEFPLILAISYPDVATMESALESSYRVQSKDVTMEIVEAYFTGNIHHHVTQCNHFNTDV